MKDTIDVKTCSIYWCAFSYSNPNSSDNLSNMKLDLNVSTRSVTTLQIARVINFSLQIWMITNFFEVFGSVFLKGHLPWHLQKWNLLHLS